MSEIVTDAAPVVHEAEPTTEKTSPAKPKVKSKPKAKKPAAKAKPASKKTNPKAPATRKPKEGLRLMQVRALKALDAAGNPMTVAKCAKVSGISVPVITRGIGTMDPKLLASHDKKNGFKSLLTLKLVRTVEVEGVSGIEITAAGEKAIGKALTETPKLPKVHAAPYSVNG